MNKVNKELLFAIILIVALLVACGIMQTIDANKPLPPIDWEDPELYDDGGWFEPYDGR